ncbi:iron-containing alcohol dehydrogenase [Streptomyces sp. NPDC050759]|uniref:iron-containing alcohol dehydrogenase n=1 Tax=Streptomyces sp. NPDC050759 TaxID=3365635 RepID=UPI0037A32D95
MHTVGPSRAVFGAGTLPQVRGEVERLARSRVMLVSDGAPALRKDTERLRDALGDLLVAEFYGAAMHTPVEATEQTLTVLREHDVDCLAAIGGGSTTGLAKALAVRTDLPQVIVPTTYAGSEVTPVLGETQNGRKITRSTPEILPETVVYDVELTLGLPVPMTVTSGVNALAHAVEALYSPDATPVTVEPAAFGSGLGCPGAPVPPGIREGLGRSVRPPGAPFRGSLGQVRQTPPVCVGRLPEAFRLVGDPGSARGVFS